jgi:hypothetical protein
VVPLYPARAPAYQAEDFSYTGNTTNGTFLGGVDGGSGVWGPEYPNGSQTVAGLDAKFDLGLWGYLFAGYSHMFMSNALTVGDAIESVHSLGAGEYSIGAVDNYLESPFCRNKKAGVNATTNQSCSNGTGSVGSAMIQYELGLANFGVFPGAQDLKLALYGMLNYVTVDAIENARLQPVLDAAAALADDPAAVPTLDQITQNGTIKTKFGMDAEFFANDWLSIAVRADHVRPHSKVAGQVFTALSPRITFKTQAVTHEQISLQYSHYFYEQRMCSATNGAGDLVAASPSADYYNLAGAPGGQTLYGAANPANGMPLRIYCTQPAPSANIPYGFGSTANNQLAGSRGSPTLLPDENVVKLEASIWW